VRHLLNVAQKLLVKFFDFLYFSLVQGLNWTFSVRQKQPLQRLSFGISVQSLHFYDLLAFYHTYLQQIDDGIGHPHSHRVEIFDKLKDIKQDLKAFGAG
jgi:hypothetical protein